MFLMEFDKINRVKNEVKQASSGGDLSSCCERCASTQLRLMHRKMYMHSGKLNRTLSASQLVDGMLVSGDAKSKGNLNV